MRRHPLSPNRANPGFTLLEVLVASSVGALLVISATSLFSPQLRIHQRLEGRTRLQERWARVNFLLDTEIQEAHRIEPIANGLRLISCNTVNDIYSAAAVNGSRCTDGANAATSTPGTDFQTDYVWNAATLTLNRTGPSINRNGSLDLANTSTHVVSTGVTVFTPAIDSQKVDYTLSFRDPASPNGPTYTEKTSAARAAVTRL